MKILILLLLSFPIFWWYTFNFKDEAFKVDNHTVQLKQSTGSFENFAGLCDSVTIFLSQLRTVPPSCCFQLNLDNKLKNAITQIKLDINTSTFTNIVSIVNQGWIVSQTPQKDILLSHTSGFIPVGGAAPLTFCLKGGFNPDSLKISFNYSAFGTVGVCNIHTMICSDPAPCQASFNIIQIGNCGHYQVTNTSTGVLPITYQWCSGETTPNLDVMLPCGPHTFCLTARCADGTTSTASQTIVVSDNIPPKAVCNPAIGVVLNTNCSFNVTPAFVDGGSTDNCQIQSLSVSPAILTGCSNQNVTLTITDWCGNQSSCQMGIQTIESVPPIITCPPTLTLHCNTNSNPSVTGVATATDNCTPTSNIVITQSDVVAGIMPCNATISRTWSAKDACDNIANCQQRILIKDTVVPSIKCPSNTVVNTNQGVCFYIGNIPLPTGSDNCSKAVLFTCSLLTPTSSILITANTQFPKGVNTITCFAKDSCGNQSSNCNFTLTVQDLERPKITCPQSISVIGNINAAGRCEASIKNLTPVYSDNCPMAILTYNYTGATTGSGSGIINGVVFNQGITNVTYYITDMSGNKDSCKFKVTVNCINTLTCPNNLVLNPSFESYTVCPIGFAPPFTATSWNLPTGGSSDYYNSCAPVSSNVSTPQNAFGYQVPHSGNAYAGFILRPMNLYREYLQVPLFSPLVAGKNYQVSFYVSLADHAQWAVDKIGAFLSKVAIGPVPGAPVLPLTPQIAHPVGNYLTDEINWTLISGTYAATGGENHLIIGNFYNDIQTVQLAGQGGFYKGAYYYLDDVSVCESCISPPCDTCCTDPNIFSALVNQGFTVVNQNCQVTLTAPQFDSCYLFNTPPILDGGLVSQIITNPSGSWTFSFTQGGQHQICVTVFDACQSKQMCTKINVNCPVDYCDSISFWIESLKTIPPACCFRLHVNNKTKNKFFQLPISLSTALFNNVTVDNLSGWAVNQTSAGNLSLSHSSGFVPIGSFTPLSWCISNGTNPDTIAIKAEFLIGHTKISCDTSFAFFCPPQPDTLCGPGCKADSISLNTGVDHATGMFYASGSPDAYWTVVQSPYPNYILPKPAYAMTTPSYWHDQPSSAMPCSKWINFSGGPYHYDQGIYEFTRCFCICKDGSRITIRLAGLADNKVDFYLCDSTGATIAFLLSSSTFKRPPEDTTVQLILDKGRYCIKASVANYGHTYTGFNLCGSVSGDGLVKEICCEPSSIIGVKYVDTSCTALPFNGSQPILQGWQIVLCNNQGKAIDTVITDVNGSYSFAPLAPGLYTVKEINQIGWTPSLPATGTTSLFLSTNQVAQVNFANCAPEKDSCCISKSSFVQHLLNAVQLTVVDSACKVKLNLRLPTCDTARFINWGDGSMQQGAFTNGMWMHTYTQTGNYTIQLAIVEYGADGKPCFDTLLRIPIQVHCECSCGRYTLSAAQNGFITPLHCNDTLTLGCPSGTPFAINGNFVCDGDSCNTPPIQWTLTGPTLTSSGSTGPGNLQINIPPLANGYYTLNFQTVCGQQKCSCKITIYQKPCPVVDTCNSYCIGNVWSQLNTSWIKDMVVYQGKLIVAGEFTSIGNPSVAANNIAAWNGASWSTLGSGVNNKVYALAVHNGILYAGGNFTSAGGNPVRKIASWNGTAWSDLPHGGINGSIDHVEALLSSAWGLVVGGVFNSVGNIPFTANNIARWNPGPGWATFGNGFNGPVYALTHFYGNIAAGGRFSNSPGGLNNLAIWTGSWTKVGIAGAVNISTPINNSEGIYAIAQFKNDLIVGGIFPSAVSTAVQNGTKTRHLAQWNGAYWTTIGIGPNPPGSAVNMGNGVFALKVINNELLVGGQFSQINGQNINNLAKWNGSIWTGFGHPANGIVESIAVYDSGSINRCNLYTGGEVLFNQWKCTGVANEDKSLSLSITIFPNPTSDKIHIQFSEVLFDKVFISMYSMLGALVVGHSFTGKGQVGEIDVSELPAGTYLIKVYTKKGTVVKKVVKR